MNDRERVNTLLEMLQVGDRGTLDTLLSRSTDWDPVGCGCCAYRPPSVYDDWSDDTKAEYDDRKYRIDDDYVLWLR